MEDLLVQLGVFLYLSLESYLIPTVLDSPQIIADVVELSGEEAPLGAKGIGEPPINIAPSAIANAVADALKPLGMTVDRLPLKPNDIWQLIQDAKTGRKGK